MIAATGVTSFPPIADFLVPMSKTKRKGLGNSKRFKVFERDSYTCRYCGQKPPEVTLEVDHFIPVKEGGDNEMSNLITSCKECNRGKKARVVRSPDEEKQLEEIIADKKEVVAQLKRMRKINDQIQQEVMEMVDNLVLYWEYLHNDETTLNIRGKTSLKTFLKHFSSSQIMEAMDLAVTQTRGNTDEFRYMCGILKNWKNGITIKPENAFD